MSQINDQFHKGLDSCEPKPATTFDSADDFAGEEITFSDIDDDEVTDLHGEFSWKGIFLLSPPSFTNPNILPKVDAYLHNQEEIRLKTIIWTEMNKEYLEVGLCSPFPSLFANIRQYHLIFWWYQEQQAKEEAFAASEAARAAILAAAGADSVELAAAAAAAVAELKKVPVENQNRES